MIVAYLWKGAMSQLIEVLGFLVIITHMPLINSKVPASALMFFSYLFEAAKFDPIPGVDNLYTKVLG